MFLQNVVEFLKSKETKVFLFFLPYFPLPSFLTLPPHTPKKIKWPQQRVKDDDAVIIQKIAKKTIPLSQIEKLRVWSGVGEFDYGCDTRSLSTKKSSDFKVRNRMRMRGKERVLNFMMLIIKMQNNNNTNHNNNRE